MREASSARDEIARAGQAAELLALAGYYHLFKLGGNLIDRDEGVIEQRVSQLLARRVLDRLGMRVEVSGLEHVPIGRPYAVVANHASYLDWALLLGYFPSPVRFIAKRELLPVPVIGDYLRLRGVLIDRSKGIDAARAIRGAARDGRPWPIVIFAEGTRSRDGRVQPFKRVGLRVLAEEGVLLLPVGIRGTHEAFPRDARRIRRGGRLALVVGEATDPDEVGVEVAIDEVELGVRAAVG